MNQLKYIFTVFFFTMNMMISLRAQTDELSIANEYFNKGEFEKARNSYEKLAKKSENLFTIYPNYLISLYKLKENSEAEKLIKRMIKSSEDNLYYRWDYFLFVDRSYGSSKSEKEYKTIVEDIKAFSEKIDRSAEYLLQNGYGDKAVDIYLIARKSSNDKSAYSYGLGQLYSAQGKTALMIDELLMFLKADIGRLELAKNTFQNNLKDEKEFDLLETILYERIQKDPDDISYNELLLWLNIQRKNFGKAFMQAKAIDKRYKVFGNKLIEVGKIALENKDYVNGAKYFQYIVDEYKNSFNYALARRYLIYAKEEQVKNTYPVDPLQIKSLITDYNALVKEFGRTQVMMEAMRSMAMLYAFYLDNRDTAKVILEDVIKLAAYDQKMKDRAKMDLADVYLLNGEPWESTLLYSQVEKDEKEDPLGHEAKLKNAKLAYYKGDFELAQSHLDILKLATSREISNDAMELSIRIQDNTGLDTSEDAMREYAQLDLLLFQNKLDQVLNGTKALIEKYKGHSLTDEIYWLQANVYRKKGDYEQALKALEKINTAYSKDILGDDALFNTALIYEENLKNKEKAMEIYADFLLKYPGSIYLAEARKRYRLLRGDKVY